jgi:hypothetical protein
MSNNPLAVEAFYKAQSLAYWSFLGLLIPVVGIICGAMSRSRLRDLEGTNEDEQYKIDHARHIAGWGVGLSIVCLIVQLIAGFIWMFAAPMMI